MTDGSGKARHATPIDFLTQVRHTVNDCDMLARGQTVVVAVSGGPDSVAMLHALYTLREGFGIRLVVAHLNHGLRGEDADSDATFVERMAAGMELPCEIGSADVSGRAKRLKESVEVAAREARYAFLEEVAARHDAERIAVGHTHSDRVETVLLNLIRGSGTNGLSGIPPVRLPFVRPLIDLEREHVERYCLEHGLASRQDASNADPRHLRNRVRTELLPLLRSYYNPRIDDALWVLATLADGDEDVLNQVTLEHVERIVRFEPEQAIIPGPELRALPIGLQRRITREVIRRMRGSLRDIHARKVETALEGVEQQADGGITLPHAADLTVRVDWSGGDMRVKLCPTPASPVPWRYSLAVPGDTEVPQARKTIRVARFETLADAIAASQDCQGFSIALKEDAFTPPLAVRSWKSGDRLHLFGIDGSSKLQDILTNAKIRADLRTLIPVLVDGLDQPMALLGVRCGAEAVRIDAEHGARHRELGWRGVLAVTLQDWPSAQDQGEEHSGSGVVP